MDMHTVKSEGNVIILIFHSMRSLLIKSTRMTYQSIIHDTCPNTSDVGTSDDRADNVHLGGGAIREIRAISKIMDPQKISKKYNRSHDCLRIEGAL
jgi:hypothetical protein